MNTDFFGSHPPKKVLDPNIRQKTFRANLEKFGQKSFAPRTIWLFLHLWCTEYCKDFTVALKMIDVIDKKQMYDSVIAGKENASEDWNRNITISLTSFNVYFVLG